MPAISPCAFAMLRPGQSVLVHDPLRDQDWSLWLIGRDMPQGYRNFTFRIGWLGSVYDNPDPNQGTPVRENRYLYYPLTDDHAEHIIFAARHFRTPEAWYNFAARQVT